MAVLRAAMAKIGDSDSVTPIPAVEPPGDGTAARSTLRRGDNGPAVETLQTALKISPADGIFGPATEAAVRVFQRGTKLVPDGIVGPATWKALGSL